MQKEKCKMCGLIWGVSVKAIKSPWGYICPICRKSICGSRRKPSRRIMNEDISNGTETVIADRGTEKASGTYYRGG